jgi:hypothetical protein
MTSIQQINWNKEQIGEFIVDIEKLRLALVRPTSPEMTTKNSITL